MASKLLFLATFSFTAFCAPAFADPIKVAAAENFYGDVANQIGGANLAVTSIITNPDEEPHFASVSALRVSGRSPRASAGSLTKQRRPTMFKASSKQTFARNASLRHCRREGQGSLQGPAAVDRGRQGRGAESGRARRD